MSRIEIATLGKPFGLRGEIRLFPNTSFPEERFVPDKPCYLHKEGKEDFPTKMLDVRGTYDSPIVLFEGITNPEDALLYKGWKLLLDEEEAPLPDGYYRYEDLKGLTVIDEKDNVLGFVKEVLVYSSVPSIRCGREGGKDFFFPFLFDEFVLEIDLENRKMKIKPMKGML